VHQVTQAGVVQAAQPHSAPPTHTSS
jgi:hypothetical protein